MKLGRNEKNIIYLLIGVFIITEIVDLLLDYYLGYSLMHTALQVILFILLFLATYRFFINYSDRKIKKLIPEELMNILKIIKEEKSRGVLVNQRKMRDLLGITKPTLKNRINSLSELQYIDISARGNNRYFILTKKGELLFD